MRLIRVEVAHFGCIRHARVELGPGLNVLYGPNDMGKSTLASAIRAALLLPHGSRAANRFVEWDSDETPSVELTFETPDQRQWRVEKHFGVGARGRSELFESKDGISFSLFKRAREVDEDWLRAHAQEQPDARLIDRVQAWEAYRGKRVQVSTMCLAMRRIGWTHKKNSGRKGT